MIHRAVSIFRKSPCSWCYKTFFGGNLDFPKIKKMVLEATALPSSPQLLPRWYLLSRTQMLNSISFSLFTFAPFVVSKFLFRASVLPCWRRLHLRMSIWKRIDGVCANWTSHAPNNLLNKSSEIREAATQQQWRLLLRDNIVILDRLGKKLSEI